MNYTALYRKFRPKTFGEMVGQEHITRTLKNQIKANRIGHAYLFNGGRGTGKTSAAKIMARAINCLNPKDGEPCNECEICKGALSGSLTDIVEMDAASNNSVEDIRSIREEVNFLPTVAKYRVYIIDEVHMLSIGAFNALLKTLEEPPEHVKFILATTEVHKVPITIQSRCQRYDFKRITKDDILKRLVMITDEMGLNADKDALSIIAIQADGGMRDALSLLDQCLAFTKDELTVTQVRKVLGLVGHDWVWQITDALAKKDSQTILTILDEIIAQGKEIKQLLNELVLHFRSIMLYKASNKLLNLNMYFEDEEVLSCQAKEFTHEQIMQIIQKIHEAINEIKWASQPRITAEVLFLKLCWQGEAENNNSEKIMPMMNNIPAVNNKGASEAKIMALEQTVSRLDRIVKALSSQLANMQEQYKSAPMTNAPMMNTSVEPRQNTVKRASKIVENEPVHTNIMPMENADATAIWQNVLAGLNARRKKVVVACVNRALPYRIADNQFFIHFDSPFLQARTEKDDYRLLIEEVLENVTGHNLRLVCTCGDLKITQMPQVNTTLNNNVDKIQEIKAPKVTIPMIEDEDVLPQGDYQADIPMPTDEDYVDIAPTDVDYDNMTPEGKHTLQTAIEIFGGKIIPEDNK